MKTNMLYGSVFLLGTLLYFVALSISPSPQSQILGEWREVSWEYEKVDSVGKNELDLDITDHIKSQIAESLIIHQAEIWNFGSDKSLKMTGNDQVKSTEWTLKGRGNILKITGNANQTEHYKIQELSPSRMVLHFNSDMQVRGIVKMTFEKTPTKTDDQTI